MKLTAITVVGLFVAIKAFALPLHPNEPLPNIMDAIQVGVLPETFTADYDFEGIAALSNCSGSLVRFETSSDADTAMILTNGHCLETGFLAAGQHVSGKKTSRSFTLFERDATAAGKVTATEIIYATMTKTDMALYRLAKTYSAIEKEFGVRPLTLSAVEANSPVGIEIISGFWKRGYRCRYEGKVHKLKEAAWTWEESLRYSDSGCETIGGTSGSPVMIEGTRTIIGVNNTANEDGKECTMNNPCEVDENGKVTYKKGLRYGQQTAWIYECLTSDHKIDLSLESCHLPGSRTH